MKKIIYLLLPFSLAACQGNQDEPDAYGNFEATEVLVPAQTAGILQEFQIQEGQDLQAGQATGLVDTLQLHLKRLQLNAQIASVLSRLSNVKAETDVLKKQLDLMETDRQRLQNLLQDGAATQKQLDDLNGNMDVTNLKIRSVRTQAANIMAEKKVLETQILQLEDQVKRSRIVSPVQGTVLEKYAEEGEMVTPGKSLFKIADLSTMYLRAFVSATQLDDLKLGQEVKVRFDSDAKTDHTLPGTLTWISPQAEFTPKIIQTKEERVTLVYAVKIAVRNNGMLKVGMPGEMIIN